MEFKVEKELSETLSDPNPQSQTDLGHASYAAISMDTVSRTPGAGNSLLSLVPLKPRGVEAW